MQIYHPVVDTVNEVASGVLVLTKVLTCQNERPLFPPRPRSRFISLLLFALEKVTGCLKNDKLETKTQNHISALKTFFQLNERCGNERSKGRNKKIEITCFSFANESCKFL